MILIDKDGYCLLTKRANGKKDAWVFPGGGIDPGETPIIAAQRELKEEAGADITLENLVPLCLHESDFDLKAILSQEPGKFYKHNLAIFYIGILTDKTKDSVQLALQKEEVADSQWVHINDLLKIVDNSFENKPKELKHLIGKYPNEYGQGISDKHARAIKLIANYLL